MKDKKIRIEKKLGYFQRENPGLTIYIGNLLYSKTESEIKGLFSKFGVVKYVKIVVDPKTNKSKGIAFVQMPDKNEALKAIEKLNGKELDGRTLKVSIANERETDLNPRPSRKQKLAAKEAGTPKTASPKQRPVKRPKGLEVLFKNIKKEK